MKKYILPSALIIIALILSFSFEGAVGPVNSINVTGSAKRDFISDVIVWEANFNTKNMVLSDAYAKLDGDRKLISDYLEDKNIPIKDVIFSSISMTEQYDYITDDDGNRFKDFSGYVLVQSLKIESNAVSKIEDLSRDITSLIDSGIQISSAAPYYFYSKLADLKIDMIAEATKDANERAKQISKNSNSKLGKLMSAQMGVFQIIAKNSTEHYSWGGTHNKTSKHKTATVTMKLSYEI